MGKSTPQPRIRCADVHVVFVPFWSLVLCHRCILFSNEKVAHRPLYPFECSAWCQAAFTSIKGSINLDTGSKRLHKKQHSSWYRQHSSSSVRAGFILTHGGYKQLTAWHPSDLAVGYKLRQR
eukprot:1161540-Pelagomonas_calceolata.AAC.23